MTVATATAPAAVLRATIWLLAAHLLFAHGCHSDEDHEVRHRSPLPVAAPPVIVAE